MNFVTNFIFLKLIHKHNFCLMNEQKNTNKAVFRSSNSMQFELSTPWKNLFVRKNFLLYCSQELRSLFHIFIFIFLWLFVLQANENIHRHRFVYFYRRRLQASDTDAFWSKNRIPISILTGSKYINISRIKYHGGTVI